jgi:hypothetical protein
MNKSIGSLHKETWNVVLKGIKNNFLTYFVLLVVSLVGIATIILAPFALRFLIGMHEMLIVDGKIDYRKLLASVDDQRNYFSVLLVIIAEIAIIAGGTLLFVVPGVVLMLSLIPLNYFLYKGMTPTMSVIIPASVELMKGKKMHLFLSLLFVVLPYGIVVGLLSWVAILLATISIFLTLPIYLIMMALSLLTAMYTLVLIVSFVRSALEEPKQPEVTA